MAYKKASKRPASDEQVTAKKSPDKVATVADWQTRLLQSLPDPLRSNLPTIEQIEVELQSDSHPKTESRS